MKKEKQARCPGCGKHCVRDCVRCKYGKNYFARLDAKSAGEKGEKQKKRKWEKYVSEGGALWQLLNFGGGAKKALKGGKITEEKLLSALDAEQREQLSAILRKMEGQIG